jgi:hypothetical protein
MSTVAETKTETTVATAPKKASKKSVKKVAKKVAPKTSTTKKVAKKSVKKAAPKKEDLCNQIMSFMRKGKDYSSREIVVGLDRTPGAAEGNPVVRALKSLVEQKLIKHAPKTDGKRGTIWTKR